MRVSNIRALLCLLLVCLAAQGNACFACLFSIPRTPTLSEVIASADVVIVVEWVSAKKLPAIALENEVPGQTTYKVVELLKDSPQNLTTKGEIIVAGFQARKPGDLALLLGNSAPKPIWPTPIPLTKTSLNYIKTLPKADMASERRLEFYLPHLEDPEELIAQDAYSEFRYTPLDEIKKISEKLPREKLRKWIADKKTIPTRLGFYGEMLGLCGEEEDGEFLADIIKQPVKDVRPWIDGMMGGYLLLKGEEGLKLLEETKLKAGAKAPADENLAAMHALLFAWDFGDSIKKDRLKQAMRLGLDHPDPDLADLAIYYLARWKDWEIQDQVMALYGHPESESTSTQVEIVQYLLTCSKDSALNSDQNPIQEHAITAKKHLGALRKIDPETVKQGERDYISFD